jgi:ubiquitin C-terminal hydrolase
MSPPDPLPNRGATCYLNSVIQWYLAFPDLLEESKKMDMDNYVNNIDRTLESMDHDLLKAAIAFPFGVFQTDWNRQQDSHEMLKYAINHNVTLLILENQNLCDECGTLKSVLEVDEEIISKGGDREITDSSWMITGKQFKCINCGIDRIHYERKKILKTNKYIIIYLIRFDNDQRRLTFEYNINPSLKVCNKNYRLVGLICHFGDGSIHSGHYVSYVNRDDYWYECNDNNIIKFDLDDKVLDLRTSVYILLYLEDE